MSFEMQDKTDIQDRIVTAISKVSEEAAIEGSFSRDIINANSIEFENAYAEMSLMIEANYADTAWGEFLTRRAAEFGVDRKEATNALVVLTLTGAANAYVIKNSLFATQDNIRFYTLSDCVLDNNGTATVQAKCGTAGAAGNVDAGTITQIPMSIAGVHSVTNINKAYDGFDEEIDAELLKRYMLIVRTPATSGNKYHYYNWAMSIEGVGACKIVPLWNGAGTVKVIIINSDMSTASADIIKQVADYIETVRPIGATVTVVSPLPLAVNVTVKGIVGTANADTFKSEITAWLKNKNIELKSISPAQIGNLLLKQLTVTDYDSILLNGKNERIVLSYDMLAAAGVITFE